MSWFPKLELRISSSLKQCQLERTLKNYSPLAILFFWLIVTFTLTWTLLFFQKRFIEPGTKVYKDQSGEMWGDKEQGPPKPQPANSQDWPAWDHGPCCWTRYYRQVRKNQSCSLAVSGFWSFHETSVKQVIMQVNTGNKPKLCWVLWRKHAWWGRRMGRRQGLYLGVRDEKWLLKGIQPKSHKEGGEHSWSNSHKDHRARKNRGVTPVIICTSLVLGVHSSSSCPCERSVNEKTV